MSTIKQITTRQAEIGELSNGRLQLHIPITIGRRNGKSVVRLPDGAIRQPDSPGKDPTQLQLALARGHRWWQMIQRREVANLTELAKQVGVDSSYVSRMVNLTNLAPDIVAAILDETLPEHISLFDLAVDPALLWDEQCERVGISVDNQFMSEAKE
ncbi:LacI family transcriptional regulator [Chitinibacter sp. GC72]|uniref:LacI family transcriptional regulator n=1 Tax=Chitinibacter sp. GC72 TaxID=1526917 RepID=UPI0012FB47A9|nr:LacI family transcriptional regulator [Chitinibacter sp. GC72]